MHGSFHSMEPFGFSMDQVVGRPWRAHCRMRKTIVRTTSSASRAAGRLRGEQPNLQKTPELLDFLSSTCPGLLEQLADEWYTDDGGKRRLKPEYAPGGKGRKK